MQLGAELFSGSKANSRGEKALFEPTPGRSAWSQRCPLGWKRGVGSPWAARAAAPAAPGDERNRRRAEIGAPGVGRAAGRPAGWRNVFSRLGAQPVLLTQS